MSEKQQLMRTPPVLLGLALLFWGWQFKMLPLAALFAVIIESPRIIKTRWEVKTTDFNLISDVCTMMLAGITVYSLATKPEKLLIYLFTWMPAVFFPLIIAQEFSVKGYITPDALLLITRKKKKRKKKRRSDRLINLTYPYLFVILLATGTINNRTDLFYPSAVVIVAISIWNFRSRRNSPIFWFLLIILAGVTGFGLHNGITTLREKVTKMTLEWYLKNRDTRKLSSSIGELGVLKDSEEIVLRLKLEENMSVPILLKESVYDVYFSPTWRATDFKFKAIRPERDRQSWKLHTNKGEFKSMELSISTDQEKAVLLLPQNSFQLENLSVGRLARNIFDSIEVEETPGLLTYRALFATNETFEKPPSKYDLFIPEKERQEIKLLANQLQLSSEEPKIALKKLQTFFQQNFRYSLYYRYDSEKTRIAHFLMEAKAGHCELFATATALLLRASGIPTRYVTGYAAHEYSKLENRIVVRKKHAHAWVQVFVDNRWINFDTTPTIGIYGEEENALFVQISDFFSFLSYKFSQLRWDENGLRKHVLWLLIPLFLIIARRVRQGKKIKKKGKLTRKQEHTTSKYPRHTINDFQLLEERLEKLGFIKKEGETYAKWLKNVQKTLLANQTDRHINQALKLYYQQRFDKEQPSMEVKSALQQEITSILEQLK